MMKKLATVLVVLAAVAGMTAINMAYHPSRTTAAHVEASEKAEAQLAEARQDAGSGAEKADKKDAAPGKAPDSFKVAFETTMGTFVVECQRAWSPHGVDRFHELVKAGYYDNNRFFRVVTKPRPFVVQFGINGDPKISAQWKDKMIKDDPVMQSNTEGYVTFAKSSRPNSRTTQIFINLADNSSLDRQGFAPFGRVVQGLDVVKSFNGQYADRPTGAQEYIHRYGNEWLDEKFPNLDYVKKAKLVD